MIKHGAYWIARGAVYHQYVGLCLDEKSFQRNMRSLDVPHPWPAWVSTEANATTHHLTKPNGEHLTLVCLREKEGETPIGVASILVHEAVHVFQFFCEMIGETRPSEEFQAYGIQNISQRLMEAYVNLTGKH